MRLVGVVAASFLLAFVVVMPAVAAPKETEPKADIEFTHLGSKSRIFNVNAKDGQKLLVRIKETCTDAFDYSFVGIERADKTAVQSEGLKKPDTRDLEIVHDKRFGGYVVNISPKPGASPVVEICEGGDKMVPLSFIVAVREDDWNMSFNGGFTVSGLTDPVFSVKADDKGTKRIVEEGEKQDKNKLGAASFVHVGHDSLKWRFVEPALAFGLGINADNHAEYMIGVGLRLGDKATVNFGRAWGSIARLPNGVGLQDPVTDDNILGTLGTRTVQRWFFGLSYSFIDTKDRLLKPFAESSGTSGSNGAGDGGAPAGQAAGKKAISAGLKKNILAVAADPETFKAVPSLKDLLKPAGPATICKVDVSDTGNVTLNVKDAKEALAQLANAGDAARDAINARIPGNADPVKEPVKFVEGCAGEQ